MAEKIDDGGAAFPAFLANVDRALTPSREGMSLRDYFAAHCPAEFVLLPLAATEAMVGRLQPSDRDGEAWAVWAADLQAKLRYIYADAMLKAR